MLAGMNPSSTQGKYLYPPVKHSDNKERRFAIINIFDGLAPHNLPNLPPTVGKLQGPIKLSDDVKNEVEVDLSAYMKQLSTIPKSLFVIEDDIDPKWNLYEQIVNCPPRTWEPLMKLIEPNVLTIVRQIGNRQSLPLNEDVFKAFRLTPLDRLKAVIIGQDPYHQITYGLPDACGLCFSYRRDFPIPPRSSLRNIFTAIKTKNYPDFIIPNHGDLTSWAKQGVLLFNSALTVAPNSPNSDTDRWKSVSSILLTKITEMVPGVIILAWGGEALKVINPIINKCVNWDTDNTTARKNINSKPILLSTSHPSGFAFKKGFLDSQHFLKVNMILELQGKPTINWNLD